MVTAEATLTVAQTAMARAAMHASYAAREAAHSNPVSLVSLPTETFRSYSYLRGEALLVDGVGPMAYLVAAPLEVVAVKLGVAGFGVGARQVNRRLDVLQRYEGGEERRPGRLHACRGGAAAAASSDLPKIT